MRRDNASSSFRDPLVIIVRAIAINAITIVAITPKKPKSPVMVRVIDSLRSAI